MAKLQLPDDFKEFLKLLESNGVEYLVIGGYAVSYYGSPRATGDIDIWFGQSPDNLNRLSKSLIEFGFSAASVSADDLAESNRVFRIGIPPYRIELLSRISGVEFSVCFGGRTIADVDGVAVSIISLEDLRINKAASRRHKDLADLENLPESSE